MTETPLPDPVRRIANSEVQTFKGCRRRWYLAYYRSLRKRRRAKSGALSLGNRVHGPLAAYYTAVSAGADVDQAAAALWESFERTRAYEEEQLDEFDDRRQWEKDLALATAMLEGYLEWLAEEGEDEDLEIVGVEENVEGPAPLEGWLLIAKKDLRFRRRSTGRIGFLDHKTVQEFTTPLKTLHLDEQMLWYLLLDRMEVDEPAEEALYSMLRKVKRTATAKPPFYHRYPVYHNDAELRAFWTRLYGMLRAIAQAQAELDSGVDHRVAAYPSPSRDCFWRCEFYPVCPLLDAEPGNAKWMLEEAYEVGDPYARYADDPDEKGTFA